MSKPKKIKDAVRVSVVLSQAQANQLVNQANRMGIQEKRKYSVSEVIRMAVEMVYPLPKQLDLF